MQTATGRTQEPELTDREMEVALYGDGRPTFHHGQDGDPSNGERIFNTKEDDAANDAQAAEWRRLDADLRNEEARQ